MHSLLYGAVAMTGLEAVRHQYRRAFGASGGTVVALAVLVLCVTAHVFWIGVR